MPKPPSYANLMQFPHCDSRILHPRGKCEFCDKHPEWQELREAWGIAFTGELPEPCLIQPGLRYTFLADREGYAPLPCPADFNRSRGAPNDHRRWRGNVATSEEPVNETAGSRMLYGWKDEPLVMPGPPVLPNSQRPGSLLRHIWKFVKRDHGYQQT